MALTLLALAACGRAPAPEKGALGGSVARVGSEMIEEGQVSGISLSGGSRALATGDALELAEEDALCDLGARARHLDTGLTRHLLDEALARHTMAHLRKAAENEGPVRDEEVADVEVVHAVVLRGPSTGEDECLADSDAIRRAVLPARDEQDFIARANAVPHPRARVVAERLPAFDASGVLGAMAEGSRLDPAFVAAAFELRVPGETSPLVETRFGCHVIRLLARRLPPSQIVEERRRSLREVVIDLRERAAVGALLRRRSLGGGIAINPDADARMNGAASRMP